MPNRTPARMLPPGWEWVQYMAGTGHLEGPQGQKLFIHEFEPCFHAVGVMFKETIDGSWSVYWNDKNPDRDFWKYAEETVLLQHMPEQECAVEKTTPSYDLEM